MSSFDDLLQAVAKAAPIPPDQLRAPRAGDVIGGEFELLEQLGAGGMGVVFRARDRGLDREVAIKLLRRELSHAIDPARLGEVLEREARATARLQHPAIVTLYRLGRDPAHVFLVLELLRGEPLSARLARGPLAVGAALAIAEQVAAGLAHAHAAGVVHRDIKPQNVFLTDDGAVKILDFGLAHLDDALTGLSRAGTPGYMAPEQVGGARGDERSDRWALGTMLREMLASPAPPAVQALVDELTDPDPTRRPSSTDGIHRRLVDLRADGAALTSLPRARISRRRTWIIPGIIALVVASAVAVVVALRARSHAPSLPAEGAWVPDPRGDGDFHGRLRRLDDGHFEWTYPDFPDGAAADPGQFRHRGELEVVRRNGRIFLEGRSADLPGWCCGNVGFESFEAVSSGRLEQRESTWGPSHDDYRISFPAWSYVRTGP